MSIYRSCTLISVKTGERMTFESSIKADFYLNRTQGYVSHCKMRGAPAYHKITREKYLYELGEPCPTHPYQSRTQTLCWECKKATGRCAWSQKLKPVKGWVVKQTKLHCAGSEDSQSYLVYDCPEFVKG